MFPLPRARHLLARTLCFCLLMGVSVPSANAKDPLAWRTAPTLQALVAHLDRWIDTHTDLPRHPRQAQIRWIDTHRASALRGAGLSVTGGHLRGLYDPDAGTIYLVRPWDKGDPRDVSVLLHELIHHRQQVAGFWLCPGAQELPAYRAQEAWLGDLGLPLDANWIAVVLEAGCTPRDFHPD